MAIHRVIEAAVMTWIMPEQVKRLSLPNYRRITSDFDHLVAVVAKMDGKTRSAVIRLWISGHFASGHSGDPDEPGAKQPDSVWNRDRGDGGHSALEGQDQGVG